MKVSSKSIKCIDKDISMKSVGCFTGDTSALFDTAKIMIN